MEDKGFTAEETAAMEAMQADTAPVTAEEQQEAEPQQEPEPQEEVQEEPEFKSSRKPPEGMVPHQAMHAEREKRKAAEEVNAGLQKQIDELKALVQPKETDPEYVDPIEDPEGHRKWTEFQAQKARDEAIAEFKKNATADGDQAARRMKAAAQEQEFIKTTPDYQDATVHLQQARLNELLTQGMTQDDAMRQLSADANAIFDAAEAADINPAQLVYMKAAEYGYTKAAPEPSPEEKIKHLAEAQEAARGAGTAGGAAQKGELTIAQMADMSAEEFAKLDPAAKRKAMGG